MAARKPLRAVTPDEKPTRRKTLVEAVDGGDYRDILVAQRFAIASAIPDEKGPAIAALHRQLSLIAKEIAAMDARENAEGAGFEHVPDDAWEAI